MSENSEKKIISIKPKTSVTTYLFLIILFFSILFVVTYNTCTVYIKPGNFGIKQVSIGINKGIHKDVYNTGVHFLIPFGFETMHIFPKRIQILELTNSRRYNKENIRKLPAANIQTSDGFFVSVDVTILYRIVDPYLVINKIGPGRLYEDNGIIPKAEPVLKETLGKLTTEEFYNSFKRSEKTITAKDMLNNELNSKGIKIEEILIRYFKYSDAIQRNIEEKKLKDQLVYKNIAETKAAAAAAELKKMIEEGKAKVSIKLEEGQAYITKKKAETDLYVRKKTAEANLLVKMADAKKIELKNKAYQVIGSDKLVGLKMAEALDNIDTIILTTQGKRGINPLDLTSMLKLFGVEKGGSK